MKYLNYWLLALPFLLMGQSVTMEVGGLASNFTDPDDQIIGGWWKFGPTGGVGLEFGKKTAFSLGINYAPKGASILYREKITHLFADTVISEALISGNMSFTYVTLPIMLKFRFDVGPDPIIPYDPPYGKSAIRLVLGGYGGYLLGARFAGVRKMEKLTIYSVGEEYHYEGENEIAAKAADEFPEFQDLFQGGDTTADLTKPVPYEDGKDRNAFKPYDGGIIAGLEFYNKLNAHSHIVVGFRAEIGMLNVNDYAYAKTSYDGSGRLVIDPYKIQTQSVTAYFQYGFRLGR